MTNPIHHAQPHDQLALDPTVSDKLGILRKPC